VYRDIPLPSWQVVFPDKLLQFRPLDLLKLDLFGLAGATAVLAQAKYSSLILELVTLVSLSVWGTRMVLGYMRMGDRWARGLCEWGMGDSPLFELGVMDIPCMDHCLCGGTHLVLNLRTQFPLLVLGDV
jgi:hypothetical protein